MRYTILIVGFCIGLFVVGAEAHDLVQQIIGWLVGLAISGSSFVGILRELTKEQDALEAQCITKFRGGRTFNPMP